MEYVRVCNDLKDKGTLIPANGTDLSSIYKRINREKDNYASIYYFTEAHNEQFKKTGSVAGITDVTTDRLVWDFDSEDSVGVAQKDAKELVRRLKKEGYTDDVIRICFSGNKGFDVSVLLKDERLTPREVKNICMNFADGLKTVDAKIYNATRILRLPLTKHPKSGLYKIPLSVEDLQSFTADEIRTAAKDNLEYADIKDAWGKGMLSKNILELKAKTPLIKTNEEIIKSLDISNLNKDAMPKGWNLAQWALFNGYFESGNRSTALLCLASFLSKSFTEDHVYRMLKGTCELQAQRTGDNRFPDTELYNNIVAQVYGPSWKGGVYSVTDPNSWLHEYASEMGLLQEATLTVSKDILTTQQVGKLFEEFAVNIDKNRISIGIKELDDALDMLVGRVYIIAGSPGSGKSSLLIQIFEGLSSQGNKAIYFSFDMSLQDNFQKIIQKEFKITAKQVFEQYQNLERRAEFHKVFDSKYSNIIFINSSGMTIDAMRDRITQAELVHGEIKVVAVDYMTLTQSDKGDSNEHSKSVIQGLKSIATDMRKCVISLNQPNKANQKINEPIGSYGGIQGSSSVQELANVILWVYRPGASATSFERDKYYSIECMKNRHGAMFSVDLQWAGVTGTVRSLTPVEKMDLERLRRDLKNEKNGESEDLF